MSPTQLIGALPPELRHLVLTLIIPPPGDAAITMRVEPCEWALGRWWVKCHGAELSTIHPPEGPAVQWHDLTGLVEAGSGSYVRDPVKSKLFAAARQLRAMVELVRRLSDPGMDELPQLAVELEVQNAEEVATLCEQ